MMLSSRMGLLRPLIRCPMGTPQARVLSVPLVITAYHSNSKASSQHNKSLQQQQKSKYSEDEKRKVGNYYSMLLASSVGIIGSSYLLYKRYSKVEAKELENEDSEQQFEDTKVQNSSSSNEIALHKSQAGFRERKIIEYENRIRSYSTPDKIFRYFATLQDVNTNDIYMAPEDFVRALTPDTMQPIGLGLDKFKKFDVKKIGPYDSNHFGADSVFHAFGDGGLVSFSDYVFLLTVLGTSTRQIDIAFKMFDLNGDGEVTLEEFKKVRSLFLSMTTTGSRHRDRKTTGNVLSQDVTSGLAKYFFGEDGSAKLTVEEFVKFKIKLQEEVMFLEFSSFNPKHEKITETQFAEILLTYANFGTSKHQKIVKRFKKVYEGNAEGASERVGVTFQDYLNFFNFLRNIRDVEMALSFHTVAGQPINKETLKQVAKLVAGVDLTGHIINIVFCIFDENQDDHLSNKEFIAVMKDKMFRGLNKPKDTGFTRFLSAIMTCAKSNIVEAWSKPSHSH